MTSTNVLHQLSQPALLSLASALESGRLTAPGLPLNLMGYVPPSLLPGVADELVHLLAIGMTEVHIAYSLRLLAEARTATQRTSDRVSLVWTGHEFPGSEARDTAVVVQELFKSAQYSVLIASYAIDKGQKAHALFQVLASRMDKNPNLEVRLFLNIPRPFKSNMSDILLLQNFAQAFRRDIWPGQRLPKVFHYPQSLVQQAGPRSCLHAKCIIVDNQQLFITSANFTEAAHERNLEAGTLLLDPVAAKTMHNQFEMLVERDVLRRIPGL